MPCSAPTLIMDCPQEPRAGGQCYYHEKLDAGLLQPAGEVLSPVELEATMEGRLRGDGRRLDSYVLDLSRRP